MPLGYADTYYLFPAHAGVILILSIFLLLIGPFPRTRGGDPNIDGG